MSRLSPFARLAKGHCGCLISSLKLPGHQSSLGDQFFEEFFMNKLQSMYSLRERNLIRLNEYECLESFHASALFKNGDVQLFAQDYDLDVHPLLYPYPFGGVGSRNIDSLQFKEQGLETIRKLAEDVEKYKAYLAGSNSPEKSGLHDSVIFTTRGIDRFLARGKRDQLIVLSRGYRHDASRRPIEDPDCDEALEYFNDYDTDAFTFVGDGLHDTKGSIPKYLL